MSYRHIIYKYFVTVYYITYVSVKVKIVSINKLQT